MKPRLFQKAAQLAPSRWALRSALLGSLFVMIALSACVNMREQLCNYDGAYENGMNDARSGRQMNTWFIKSRCPENAVAEAMRGYREGYTGGTGAVVAVPIIGGGTSHAGTSHPDWKCIEAYGKKQCGYSCIEAYGKLACGQNPGDNCVEAYGKIRCGRNCREEYGKIQCDG